MKQRASTFSLAKQSSSQSSFRKKSQPGQKTLPDLTAEPICSSCKASTSICTIPTFTAWTSLKQNSCAEHFIHKFLANHDQTFIHLLSKNMMGFSNAAEKLLPVSGAHKRQCSAPMRIQLWFHVSHHLWGEEKTSTPLPGRSYLGLSSTYSCTLPSGPGRS